MSRQQGNAPWRTQGGAFLLVKKKHCPDRYAYRTRQHYKPTTTKNLLPCDITMPRFFVSRQNPTFHISASQRTRPRAMDGQGHCKDTGSRTGTSATGIYGQLPSARDLPRVEPHRWSTETQKNPDSELSKRPKNVQLTSVRFLVRGDQNLTRGFRISESAVVRNDLLRWTNRTQPGHTVPTLLSLAFALSFALFQFSTPLVEQLFWRGRSNNLNTVGCQRQSTSRTHKTVHTSRTS